MEEKDFIQELFADKLANAEAPVNPELWNAISSKIGTGTAASSGLSSTAKWFLGLGSAAAITTASLIYVNRDPEASSKANKQEMPQQQAATQEEQKTSVSFTEEKSLKTTPGNDNQSVSSEGTLGKETNESSSFNSHPAYTQPERDETRNSEQQPDKEALPYVKPKEKEMVANDKQHPASSEQEHKNQPSSAEIGQLPNVFTPNNDSENDFFYISVKGLQDFVLTVLNEKNETVFRTTDPDFKWDGRDQQGNLLPAGNKYVYFFSGKDGQGNPVTRYNKLEIRY